MSTEVRVIVTTDQGREVKVRPEGEGGAVWLKPEADNDGELYLEPGDIDELEAAIRFVVNHEGGISR
jgi:hypothetical protein